MEMLGAVMTAMPIWDTTNLRATARDLVDPGIWEVAEDEERTRRDRKHAEFEYQDARRRLVLAQAERTTAVCRFLAAQAEWAMTSAAPQDNAIVLPTANSLEDAESELRRAKTVFCSALEQNQLAQTLLRHSRAAFQHAQERLEELAMAERPLTAPRVSNATRL